jgi:hypothetical protein
MTMHTMGLVSFYDYWKPPLVAATPRSARICSW